jgi:hypothetical protein
VDEQDASRLGGALLWKENLMQRPAEPKSKSLISPERRRFMRMLLFSASAGLVTACAPRSVAGPQPFWLEATPNVVLPSPQPPLAPDGTPTPEFAAAPDADLLASFLALSVLLTGMDEAANPTLGSVYLSALQANTELEAPIDEVIRTAGFENGEGPLTLDALRETGLLDDEATRAVANRIVNTWYSGTYTDAEGNQQVATFVDALAWKSLVITKPLTICAYFGVWAMPPDNIALPLPGPRYLEALRSDQGS